MGGTGQRDVLDESAVAHPRNAYEKSKLAGEQAALGCHTFDGMNVVVVRPTIVYGEGRDPRSDSFLAWVRAIKKGRFLQIGGRCVSSYVYVRDVVAACLAVSTDNRAGGEAFTVNDPISLPAFVTELAKLLGVRVPGSLPWGLGVISEAVLRSIGRFGSLYNHTTYSMEKLGKTGFTLPFGYREGLRRTLHWYVEQGLL